MSGSIHATAIVAPDAVLGEGVEIGAYCVIGPGVVVGARTRLGAHAAIHCHTRLGADNVVHSYASVGDAPQDKKYQGEATRLEIGDRLGPAGGGVDRPAALGEATHQRFDGAVSLRDFALEEFGRVEFGPEARI
jgi:hypothetical protein